MTEDRTNGGAPWNRMALLEIKDLAVDFVAGGQGVRAVDGLSLSVNAGEVVCLVGESGCGKSVTALSIARLLPAPPARWIGEIKVNGADVFGMSPEELRRIRGGVVSYVFQDPGASLNPVLRVGDQVLETLKAHRPDRANSAEVTALLKSVGIPVPERRAHDYPFQLSGGMQQRVMLAIALASEPQLLVADEPTTALDVTIQAQILDLLGEFKERSGMGMLFITHNLAVVADLADRVAVMYAGQLVEVGPASDLLRSPKHPYTRALIDSVPRLGRNGARLSSIPGNVPRPGEHFSGCRFAPRCPIARPECFNQPPALRELGPGLSVRCPFSGPPTREE